MRDPLATYRLQLRKEFDLDTATAMLDYLSSLGVSHVYLSPILQAAPGSTHGYDVVDHSCVNVELGGNRAFERLCARASELGLELVVDIVPNHMSIAVESNRWWWSVLENGPASPHSHCFDVDWDAPHERQRNKVLMPILPDHYGNVVESGELRVGRSGSDFFVFVGERRLPVAPLSLPMILTRAMEECDSPKLAFCAEVLAALPLASERDPISRAIRGRHHAVIGELLLGLFEATPEAAYAVDGAMAAVNGDPDLLDQFLERQNYRLAYWRVARHDLDYRRFFDINELAALRMSDRRVFDETHRVVLHWLREGRVSGLRIDHPDGLQDPEGYLRWLRTEAPEAWIVVEKILEPGESLPSEWPVDGTTGYDFLHYASSLFVDPAAEEEMTRIWIERTGEEMPAFDEMVHGQKRQVLAKALAPDLARLTRALQELCVQNRRYRDFAYDELRDALAELIANMPVYRTYRRQGLAPSEADTRVLETAMRRTLTRLTRLPAGLRDLLHAALTGKLPDDQGWPVAARFQQLSGPVMAKALEDTIFYRHQRLVCMNEVGSTPARFGLEIPEFHAFCLWTAQHHPRTMLTTSTHDTKRSEDTRIRIALLSQTPKEWDAASARWNARLGTLPGGEEVGGPFRYLLLQTLVGAWPIDYERLSSYMLKAAREAKLHTSWVRTNESYENALQALCRAVLDDAELCQQLHSFVGERAAAAMQASLALQLIKLTAPGIPDVYQGTELWDYSLADPDNRRAVDFSRRAKMLNELVSMSTAEILRRAEEGYPKLYLTWRLLQTRRADPKPFATGSAYQPLSLDGPGARRAVAYSRGGSYVVLAPTLVLGADWSNTRLRLPPGRWDSLLSASEPCSGEVSVAQLTSAFPVALLKKGAS